MAPGPPGSVTTYWTTDMADMALLNFLNVTEQLLANAVRCSVAPINHYIRCLPADLTNTVDNGEQRPLNRTPVHH